MYEITDRLEKMLHAEAAASVSGVPLTVLLSDAARRATHGVNPDNILESCLKLNEVNYPEIAANEHASQQSVKPVVDYLRSKGIEVKGRGSHSFEYLELLMPSGKQTTLKVELSVLYRTPKQIVSYCSDYDIAGQLAKTLSGENVEINESSPIPRDQKDV